MSAATDYKHAWADWLHQNYYPFDWRGETEPPQEVLEVLVQLYVESEGGSLEECRWAIRAELDWKPGD